jgi:uncharacterized protein DUF402
MFASGDTVIQRDILHGRVWYAQPHRVLRDTGDELLLAYWPGIVSLSPTSWTEWLRTGDDAPRKRGIPELVDGTWELEKWEWRDTGRLSWHGVDDGFSVHRYFDTTGTPLNWYVNFERPSVRTLNGLDGLDLLVDLIAAPDLSSWSWKDEDEYALARGLGLIDDAEDRRVRAARRRAVAMIEARGGPFAEEWAFWRASDDWPLPVLPADAAVVGP